MTGGFGTSGFTTGTNTQQYMQSYYQVDGLISQDFISLNSVPFKPDYTSEAYNGSSGLWHGRADAIETYSAQMVDEEVVVPAPAAVLNKGDTYTINDAGEIELTDTITQNEMGMPAGLVLQFLTTAGKWPGLQYRALKFYGTGELAVKSVEVWSEGDDAHIIPSMDVLTEYLSEYNGIFSDLFTYAMETASAFITGNKDFSEWDSYIETLKNTGIDRCIEIMQAAYDDFAGCFLKLLSTLSAAPCAYNAITVQRSLYGITTRLTERCEL